MLDLGIHISFLGTTVLCSVIVILQLALLVSTSVNYLLARYLLNFIFSEAVRFFDLGSVHGK